MEKEKNIFRAHKSHLVNLACVKNYRQCDKKESYATMQDGYRVPVARERRNDFLKKLFQFHHSLHIVPSMPQNGSLNNILKEK